MDMKTTDAKAMVRHLVEERELAFLILIDMVSVCSIKVVSIEGREHTVHGQMSEGIGLDVVFRYPHDTYQIDMPTLVANDLIDIIVAQGVLIPLFLFENPEILAIVKAHSIAGTKPQKTTLILIDGDDRIV